jgi:hypothetical protein
VDCRHDCCWQHLYRGRFVFHWCHSSSYYILLLLLFFPDLISACFFNAQNSNSLYCYRYTKTKDG